MKKPLFSALAITCFIFIIPIFVFFFSMVSTAIAQPIFNEIMSSNTSTFQDEDGDNPDWIEIYNPGDTFINLSGYGLSDRPDNPYKWVFSAIILAPKEYLIVSASGKNRTKYTGHWETIITQGDEWKYFVGTSEPPSDWNSINFDDSEWMSGPTSIGSTENDATRIPLTISVYLRKKFYLEDIKNINQVFLQIDFQDGFYAYINSVLITGDNLRWYNLSHMRKPDHTRDMTMINGGLPEVYNIEEWNRGYLHISDFLVDGENVLAIQVHARYFSEEDQPHFIYIPPRDIGVIPFLTFEYSVPPSNPKGVPEIIASTIQEYTPLTLHTNFKISNEGETLVLTDPDGVLCDSVYTKIEGTNISLGRELDGGKEWVLYSEPTPGKSNIINGYQGYSDAVVETSLPGGFYDSPVTLELSTDTDNTEIKYTIDGSDPTETSTLYTSPIAIDTTTVVRAQVFEDNLFPGSINTQTYFIDVTSILPVISLSTDPENFWDEDIGIYVEGSNYNSEDRFSANYFQDWERPIHIEFYEPDGNPGFSIDGGIKISGLMIRKDPQKSFAFFVRPKYGFNKIGYQILPDLPINEFKSITLRNGGNEIIKTRFTDALCQNLVKVIGLDIMAFRPAIVFLNGVYWGMYNIREKQNEDYLSAHHSIDPNNVDILELDPFIHIIEGDNLHFSAMRDYIKNYDMNNPVHYEYIKTQMDMENFIDYNVAEIYLANTNWTDHNVKMWRPKTPNGRWRWLLCDLDYSMWQKSHNFFGSITTENTYYVEFLFKLLENDNVKNKFINQFADYMNTIFNAENMIQNIHEIKKQLEPEMTRHIERWNNFILGDMRIHSIEDWYNNIQKLEEFAEERPDSIRNQIIEHFGLSGLANVNLSVSSPEAGKIKINSIIPDNYPWDGIYFKDVPIQLTAIPNLGYRFTGWTGVELDDSISATITLIGDISVTAVFEKIGSNDVVIDSFQSPYRIQGIQAVASGSSLTIEAGVELLMSPNASINVSGEIHLNGTPDNPIIISAEGSQNWNGIFLDNASGNSVISNVVINGASTWDNPEGFPAAISSLNSDVTFENVRFENNRQSIFARGGTVTVRNCFFAESNKHEPINIKNATALVENCRFENVFFEDAIDFDGIVDGIIIDNEIFGTVDSDGDGIDIGDDCVNVLVTGNLIYDCMDKGISIGEGAKDISVERNIIAGCLYGIAVKDSATAFIDHNTLFDNGYAVAAYEKGGRRFGGGTAVVTNSILSQSSIATLFTDELSEITVSYTLSDLELLEGECNLMADPMIAAPASRIFDILPGSPILTADSDGAELGALLYRETISNVVINEINYNSSDDFNPGDWIELYNITENNVDISGWTFKDEDDTHAFEIPANTVLLPYAYIVLCSDETLFQSVFPDVSRHIGSFGFGLNAAGEVLRLYDADSELIDWVVYDDSEPWPVEPDGSGATLSLINAETDNVRAGNWSFSTGNGTPGWVNDKSTGIDEDDIPLAFSLGQNYPNPFNPVTTIPFSIPEAGFVELTVYNISGQKVRELLAENMSAGVHTIIWDGRDENGAPVSSGVFITLLKTKDNVVSKRMLLIK
ncbi:CotH kinase family protein [Candidatus Latescibacterota bacterium]